MLAVGFRAVDSPPKTSKIAAPFPRLEVPCATDCDFGQCWQRQVHSSPLLEPASQLARGAPGYAVQFRERVRDAVATDAWVCEGNYARRTFDLRLPNADLIIWLDTPRLTCLARVIVRSLMNRPRPDLPAGCREKLDRAFLTFLKFVWRFDHGYRQGIDAVRMAIGPKVPTVHLRGNRQIAAFLDGLPSAATTHYS